MTSEGTDIHQFPSLVREEVAGQDHGDTIELEQGEGTARELGGALGVLASVHPAHDRQAPAAGPHVDAAGFWQACYSMLPT